MRRIYPLLTLLLMVTAAGTPLVQVGADKDGAALMGCTSGLVYQYSVENIGASGVKGTWRVSRIQRLRREVLKRFQFECRAGSN